MGQGLKGSGRIVRSPSALWLSMQHPATRAILPAATGSALASEENTGSFLGQWMPMRLKETGRLAGSAWPWATTIAPGPQRRLNQ